MKKRVLSVLLSALMLLSILPVTIASANIIGDVDGDGYIKAADARLALRASVGLEVFTAEQTAAADVDFDGVIKAADARMILRASVGLENLHTHSYKDAVTKQATCTEKGVRTFTCECGDTYTEEIEATGHTEVTDKAVAPTCTVKGKTEGSHCSVCGTVIKAQTDVAVTGHTAVTDKAVAPTCTVKGKTEGSHCSVCGTVIMAQTDVAATGHTAVTDKAVAPTCTVKGKTEGSHCSVCGTVINAQTDVAATGHKNTALDKSTVKAATCKENGYSGDYKCGICKTVTQKGSVVASQGTEHVLSNVTVNPSCLQGGYTVDKCKYCDYFDANSIVENGTQATGHTLGAKTTVAPTCTENGYDLRICSVCTYEEITNEKSANGHSFTWKRTKKATCVETGTRVGTCSECSTKETEVIPLTACTIEEVFVAGSGTTPCKVLMQCTVEGCNKTVSEREFHKYMAVESQTQATCVEHGLANKKCNYCDYTETGIVTQEASGHTATINFDSTTMPTCTTDGSIVYEGSCSVCNESLDNRTITIRATGHNPTGTQTCTDSVTCTRCTDILEAALGHNYVLSSTAYKTDVATFYCSRCGESVTAKLSSAAAKQLNLQTFNTLVNGIKTTDFPIANSKVDTFGKTSVNTSYTSFDFGIYTSMIKDMYEEEMANTPDDYAAVRSVSVYTSLPLLYEWDTVSELTVADVDSVKVEKLSGVNLNDVLSSYSTKFTVGKTEYDITKYKNIKITDSVIKVTVDIKDEKYYGDVENLASTEKTSLQKIYDTDMREELGDFKKNSDGKLYMTDSESSDGYSMNMTMVLNEISTDAKVTYYFLESTYEPIAAVYDIYQVMNQTISMKFTIGLTINGKMTPVISTHNSRVYIFPSFIPQ